MANGLESMVKKLGDKYHVITAGWNGTARTWSHTVFDDSEWKDFVKKVKDA